MAERVESEGEPSHPLAELRLGAGLVATEARMLPLELPELLPGMPLAPPPDPEARTPDAGGIAHRVLTWAESALTRIGRRCGRPAEYDLARRLLRNRQGPPLLPASGPIPAATLEARLRATWDAEPQMATWWQWAAETSEAGALHRGALADAVRTVFALWVLAGELVADEAADAFRLAFPNWREVPPPEAADVLKGYLAGRFGGAVTGVYALGNGHVGSLRVKHDGALPPERLAELADTLTAYCGTDDGPDVYPLLRPQGDVRKSYWLAALFPDGSAARLRRFAGPPYRRLRHGEVPEGAQLVWFAVYEVGLHPRPFAP